MIEKRLYRSCSDKLIGGVAAGIAEYFSIDPVIIRLIFVLLAFPGGIGIIFYIVAMVIIPEDPKCAKDKGEDTKGKPLDNTRGKKIDEEKIKEKAKEFAEEIKSAAQNFSQNQQEKGNRLDSRLIFGLVILAIGVMFLFQNLLGFNVWSAFWPIILIIIGAAILINDSKK
jgi:phage shock protein PspC (stress-responsive transcriptional regulator)/F0F1-type ATP synthase assembly protein I